MRMGTDKSMRKIWILLPVLLSALLIACLLLSGVAVMEDTPPGINPIIAAKDDNEVESIPVENVSEEPDEEIFSETVEEILEEEEVSLSEEPGEETFDLSYDKEEELLLMAASEEYIAIDATNFPDSVFRKYVTETFDVLNNGTLHDGKLSYEERVAVSQIVVNEQSISSLKGVEFFPNLSSLLCESNQLTSLDVSNNTQLSTLICPNNQLTSLDISGNAVLESLS